MPPRRDAGRAYVPRFAASVRAAHWLLAAPFLLLLLSGLTNFAPSIKAVQVADVRLFAWLHVVLGFATLAAVPLLLLPLLLRRAVRSDLLRLATVNATDYRWLRHTLLSALAVESRLPPVGKFNAGQKLNALASLAATVGLLGTGAVLGVNYVAKGVFPVGMVEDLFRWHTLAALLAVPLVLGHLYLALLHRSTRESLRGITRGVVRRDWAERHHGAWLAGDGGPGEAGEEAAHDSER